MQEMTRVRRVGSVKGELLIKSQEAALTAVQLFNNPLIRFKTESFIVLMIIAWTYLLHAYYRSLKVEYRYYEQRAQRRRFVRSKGGGYKYWELERCLNVKECPLDRDTVNNLRFLLELRHEIEHQMTMRLDDYLSGRYQACALNYNHYITKLFGDRYALDTHLTYSIQFMELTLEQAGAVEKASPVPERLRSFITQFDNRLTDEEYESDRYSYRLLFKKKLAARPGQADKVVEFIDPDSELAKTIDKEYWVKKEVERPKYLPSEVVRKMVDEGYSWFTMYWHTELWKKEDGKNPGKGYGTEIGTTWYWYERWVDRVREFCREEEEKRKSSQMF
jgi:hypothetical protein